MHNAGIRFYLGEPHIILADNSGGYIRESTSFFDENLIVGDPFTWRKDAKQADVYYIVDLPEGRKHLTIKYRKGMRPAYIYLQRADYAL
ncbi:hypothetical protein DRW41_22095 [Neobacillus piezotolerans]|uniref:Uncharacterized protein n=1 Tax=Neobacillus piezotolerans TaxID=2259171 RepID=A0A3D8GKD3_9BACI|nr:hypothetical protein [Neobacillus piezotolerans]RDU34719.1 hypothetical protein DRW41_22095 [Neobacillus piezotolerans]